MDPGLPFARFAVLMALVGASGFFSASEAALFSLGVHRIRRLKADALRSYQAAQRLLREPIKLISTILIGNEFINTAIGIFGSGIVYQVFSGRVGDEFLPLLAVGTVLPFVVIGGEILPKILGVKNPERVAMFVSIPLEGFSDLIAPVRNAVSRISEGILRWTGGPAGSSQAVSEEVFRSMVDAGTEEGVVESYEQRLIHNVFRLDDLRIAQIMTPKASVFAIRVNTRVDEALDRFRTERYSRAPVLNADGREVVGMLYLKDLVARAAPRPDEPVSGYIRKALLVSPHNNALELFALFRTQRTHFAVVMDPANREVLGVVTLDDVLKEVFGRIRDERDIEEDASSKRS